MKTVAVIFCGLLRLYRAIISPVVHAVLGPACGCRYAPTCSEYALTAVQHHGPARGGWLALRRVCRCHPWGGAGWDPVPPATPSASKAQS